MSRMTKYNKDKECYEISEHLSEKDLINLLGISEDRIEKLEEKSAALIKSSLDLLEITKGEKDKIQQEIQKKYS